MLAGLTPLGWPINTLIQTDKEGKKFTVYEPNSYLEAFEEFKKKTGVIYGELNPEISSRNNSMNSVNLLNATHTISNPRIITINNPIITWSYNSKPYFDGDVLLAVGEVSYIDNEKMAPLLKAFNKNGFYLGLRHQVKNEQVVDEKSGAVITISKVKKIITYDIKPYIKKG